MLFLRQIRHATLRLEKLLNTVMPLARVCSVHSRATTQAYRIRTDASPWGMGGVLLHKDDVVAWWADPLGDADYSRFHAQAGEAAFQSVWEFLAVVVSLSAFSPWITVWPYVIVIESDNTAALVASLKQSSKQPHMNAIAAALACKLEQLGVERIVPHHVAGVVNMVADALSRLSQGASLPLCLRDVPR
eukprot:6461155-Amphidinium_carterae.1